MAKAKKSNGRAKAQPKAESFFESNAARKQVTNVITRVQDGFREAGDAFREAGEAMGGESRKVALKLVNHAQDNVLKSFEALRDTIQAESFGEAVRIQQNAFADFFRRSLQQMREVSEIVGDSGNKTLKPITKFVSSIRDYRDAA